MGRANLNEHRWLWRLGKTGSREVVDLACSRNKVRLTRLHSAARCGQLDVTLLLLEHDVEVNVKEQCRWTQLHFALWKG
jgi:Ankyrin repeats (many copies)